MRKIILDLNAIDPADFDKNEQPEDPKKALHRYIAEEMGLFAGYPETLDALYDSLISIDEPTAIGLFMPGGDPESLDIDYMMYLDKIKAVFEEAEADNPELAVIHGDVVDNNGVSAGEDVDALLGEYLGMGGAGGVFGEGGADIYF